MSSQENTSRALPQEWNLAYLSNSGRVKKSIRYSGRSFASWHRNEVYAEEIRYAASSTFWAMVIFPPFLDVTGT